MVSCNRFYNNSTKDSQIIRHQKLVPHTFATDCFQRYRIILKDTSKYKNKSTHHTTQDYNASSKTIYSFVMHYYISLKNCAPWWHWLFITLFCTLIQQQIEWTCVSDIYLIFVQLHQNRYLSDENDFEIMSY